MPLTPDKIEKIETLRTTSSSQELEWLKRIQTAETGYTYKGCFCKSVNKDAFLKQFYDWYDSVKP